MIKPVKVTQVELVFGSKAMELLPKYDEIPKEFKDGTTKWNKLVSEWFYYGLKRLDCYPKEGIDKEDAIRHVKAILSSFTPKHEHKLAGCAYLLSEFFKDIDYEANM